MSTTIHTGDCVQIMRDLICARSVNTCVTSPPYFGLRDYGNANQIGLEQTPDEYVAKLVEVFRAVRDVLRDDGTLWLNLGDSYAQGHGGSSTMGNGVTLRKAARAPHVCAEREGIDVGGWTTRDKSLRNIVPGTKPKDMLGIPWRVAFALQADGWWLRQDIIWAKPNPMPESVTDRCTKSHEYIFLLSKSPRYYFDHEAIKESAVGGQSGNAATFKREGSKREQAIPGQSVGTHRPDRDATQYNGATRNRRDVWNVATRPYKGAHFATFPPELIEPCILAGSPAGGMVLDPFGGAGTTGVVAKKTGRDAVLCELNPEYVAMANTRIEAYQAQVGELV